MKAEHTGSETAIASRTRGEYSTGLRSLRASYVVRIAAIDIGAIGAHSRL